MIRAGGGRRDGARVCARPGGTGRKSQSVPGVKTPAYFQAVPAGQSCLRQFHFVFKVPPPERWENFYFPSSGKTSASNTSGITACPFPEVSNGINFPAYLSNGIAFCAFSQIAEISVTTLTTLFSNGSSRFSSNAG